MSDVFISYARRDKEFVRRLHQALQERGRDTWIDLENIPPSAEWLREIFGAIEATDTFVFVISPHSSTSPICSDEVAHAIRNNKRIVPLLREDVEPSALPKAVQERNWIFFRATDDFDQAFELLIRSIDTDLDWVRAHTRLLTRAIDWDNNRRDLSFALRGSDLRNAEASLATGELREPRLTPLQIEYILASRRDVNRRRTMTIGFAALAVSAILIFGLLFWQKRHENNLNLAADFREKGLSELAVNNASAAEVLFARALTIDDTADARQLLLQARAKSLRLLWVGPQLPESAIVAVSGDGAFFAVETPSAVEIWSVIDRRRVRAVQTRGKNIQSAAFGGGDRLLAIAADNEIAIWNLASDADQPVHTFKSAYDVSSLSVNSRGGRLISGSSLGVISIWRLDDRQAPAVELRGHTKDVTSLVVSPDGQSLISGGGDDTVRVWDLRQSREERTLIGHDDTVLCVAISPNGELVASGGWDNVIWIWEARTGKRLRALEGHRGSIRSVAFSRDGKWLASSSEDRTARLWDVDKGTYVLMLPGHEADVISVAFADSGDGTRLVTGDAGGTVRLWDIDSIGQRGELITLRGHERPVTMFAFSTARSLLVSGSVDRTIRLWDLKTRRQSRTLVGHQENVAAVKLSPDGRHFASASRDSTVRIWDLDTGAVQILAHAEDGVVRHVRDIAYSPDGLTLASGADDGKIRMWDARDGRLLHVWAGHPVSIRGLEFSPDGRLLASSGGDAIVRLWLAKDWSLARELIGHLISVYQIAFSPDGRLLLSAGEDKTARLWDVESGRELVKPIEHRSPVWSVDFSPDGNIIATGCEDWTVHLWKLAVSGGSAKIDGHQTFRIADGPVWHVMFGQVLGEPMLGIAGQDKTIRLLNLRVLQELFSDPARLEADAERQSGLQVHTGGAGFDLVPLPRERLAIP